MDPPAVPAAGRVRFVRSASAPLPPSVLRRFEEAYGIPVIETYGMTEAASMIAANPLDGPRKADSVGQAGTQVRIARLAAGRYVPSPALEVGRVQIRGRGVITEYAQNGPPGAIDPDGWLDTGDPGHLDQDGYLFLAGRSDDVINRGGEKIYPRENRGRPARPARRSVRRGGRSSRRRARGAPGRLGRPGRSVPRRAGGRRRPGRSVARRAGRRRGPGRSVAGRAGGRVARGMRGDPAPP